MDAAAAARPICDQHALVEHNCRVLAGVLGVLAELRAAALPLLGINSIVTAHGPGQAESSLAASQQLVTVTAAPQLGSSRSGDGRSSTDAATVGPVLIVSMSTPEISAYADLAHANHEA